MKRFWWDGTYLNYDNGFGTKSYFHSSEQFETDYRGSEPREIQSAEYNPETGRIKLVPKEPVKPRKVMVEIELPEASDRRAIHIYGFCNDGSYASVFTQYDTLLGIEFHLKVKGVLGQIPKEAIEQQPSNPYTKEAVDAFLDATATSKNWLNDDAPSSRWYGPARDMWDAFQVLLKQREASGK